MTELMEQPFLIVGMGVVATAICICGLVKTGKPTLLYAAIATGLLFGCLLLAERLVKTDKEQIEIILRDIAGHVENNDVDGVVQHIHTRAGNIRTRASNEMPRYRFDLARITKIREVEVDSNRPANKAKAEFTVRLQGSVVGTSSNGTVIRIIELDLQKEDDRWKVKDYTHYPFSVGGEKKPDLWSNVR